MSLLMYSIGFLTGIIFTGVTLLLIPSSRLFAKYQLKKEDSFKKMLEVESILYPKGELLEPPTAVEESFTEKLSKAKDKEDILLEDLYVRE